VRAVSLQLKLLCRRIDTQYKQHLQKDCQFYQRTYTRRYFTESCKKITAFCHNYRQVYRRPYTLRYFTESCKTITVFCHNYRQTCHNYRRIYQRVHQRMAHIPKCTPVRSYRWICRRTWQNQYVCALEHNFRRICRWTSKNMEGFSKILVQESIKY